MCGSRLRKKNLLHEQGEDKQSQKQFTAVTNKYAQKLCRKIYKVSSTEVAPAARSSLLYRPVPQPLPRPHPRRTPAARRTLCFSVRPPLS